jgi:PTH1 family peptidyl-tRNA hydrolase
MDFYIVGLGNPGEQYVGTRHNIGWDVLDHCVTEWQLPGLIQDRNLSGQVTDGEVCEKQIAILYPSTFMNNSGVAVAKMVSQGDAEKLIVVHDDIDLPIGEVKVSRGRGDGGNNGVKSIIEQLGSKDFTRVRVGIAPRSLLTGVPKRPAGGGPLERFVLKRFGIREQKHLEYVREKAKQIIETILTYGVDEAMNRHN